MRVLALARVSSVKQSDGTSLEAQSEAFAAHCRSCGLPEPAVYVEVESAGEEKQDKRGEVERVIRDAQPGDVVLVTKVDRWSRNLPWGIASVRALVKRGVGWRSIGEGIDAATPNGDFVLGIMLAVADQERQRIRERTVVSRQRLREQGYHVEGHPPLGYRVEGGRGRWKLVPDPERAPVVRQTFALCLGGKSTREIAATLHAAFPCVRGIDHASVARILKDRRYIGESSTRGTRGSNEKRARIGTWRPTHEALIDADTWHRAQAALAGRKLGGRTHGEESRTAAFLLRGMVHCGLCSRRMAAHAPRAGRGYYQCVARRVGVERCRMPMVRQDEADAAVEALALDKLGDLADLFSRPAEKRPPPHDFAAERAKLARKRKRIVDAVAADAFSFDDARESLREIEASIAALDARERAETAPAIDRAALLGQIETLRRLWQTMTLDEKRQALRLLTDAITVVSTAERRWQRGAWRVEVTWHTWN